MTSCWRVNSRAVAYCTLRGLSSDARLNLSNASSVLPEDRSFVPALNCFLAAASSPAVGGAGTILVLGDAESALGVAGGADALALVETGSCAHVNAESVTASSTPAATRIDEEIL